MIWNVLRESLAMATQPLAKIPYGAVCGRQLRIGDNEKIIILNDLSLTVARNFDAEDEPVSDSHRFHVASGGRVQNADARRRSLRRRRDADHFRISAKVAMLKKKLGR